MTDPVTSTVTYGYPGQPLYQLVNEYTRDGGRRVLFWDTHHGSPLPREVFSDPELRRVVQKNGLKLTYVIEDATGLMPWIAPIYRNGPSFVRQQIDALMDNTATLYHPADPARYAYAVREPFRAMVNNPDNVQLVFPDTRSVQAFTLPSTGFTYYMRSILQVDPKCLVEAAEYEKSLPPRTRAAFETENKRFEEDGLTGLLDGSLDKGIAENIQKAEDKGRVQFVLYGAGHYSKGMDLDEQAKGLSIGVVTHDHLGRLLASSSREELRFPKSFPDYSWNPKTRVLEKLDNDAAKARFLGFTPEEYDALRNDPNAVPKLPPAEAEACRAVFRELAASHPRIRGEEGRAVTPPPPTPAVPKRQPSPGQSPH